MKDHKITTQKGQTLVLFAIGLLVSAGSLRLGHRWGKYVFKPQGGAIGG